MGVRVLELAGIGPGPFGAMVLADLGADVVRVDRIGRSLDSPYGGPTDPVARSRRSVAVDLRTEEGVGVVRRLAQRADVLVDPFRPGVLERRGLGPDVLCALDPRLVYARMTGWGQTGPLADHAGHDINYIALTGTLHGIGRPEAPPTPPANYLADFGGGGMLLAVGILVALLEREQSGRGQVLDVAMVDGSALLTAFVRGMVARGGWIDERGQNFVDGGSHYYDSYETADGKFVAIGTIEPQFYHRLLELLGLDDEAARVDFMDRRAWAELKPVVADIFRTKTRDEWCAVFEGETETCFAPVLQPRRGADPPAPARPTDLRRAGRPPTARSCTPLQPQRARPTQPRARARRRHRCGPRVGRLQPRQDSGAFARRRAVRLNEATAQTPDSGHLIAWDAPDAGRGPSDMPAR